MPPDEEAAAAVAVDERDVVGEERVAVRDATYEEAKLVDETATATDVGKLDNRAADDGSTTDATPLVADGPKAVAGSKLVEAGDWAAVSTGAAEPLAGVQTYALLLGPIFCGWFTTYVKDCSEVDAVADGVKVV